MKLADFKLLNDESKDFYKQIWQEGEYDRFGIAVEPGDIVVDCGANIGIFSQYAVSRGARHVYSFESDPQIYEYLKVNTSQTDKITTINGYVGEHNHGGFYNLERILRAFSLDYIDFFKVDIEGAEVPFIFNADVETFNRVRKWAIELHLFSMFRNDCADFVKALGVLEKFSVNGFNIRLRYAHPRTCLWMLHAAKSPNTQPIHYIESQFISW